MFQNLYKIRYLKDIYQDKLIDISTLFVLKQKFQASMEKRKFQKILIIRDFLIGVSPAFPT